MEEGIVEQSFPIRISASPGRDCKEVKVPTTKSTSSKIPSSSVSSELNGMHGLVSQNAILNAIDDDTFKNDLTEEEKAAFCKGMITTVVNISKYEYTKPSITTFY